MGLYTSQTSHVIIKVNKTKSKNKEAMWAGKGVLAWWRHQMKTFSALLAVCAGISPVPGEFPAQGQWRGALMFSLICVWINDWVNNREAGDLRRYRAHCDVIVMGTAFCSVIDLTMLLYLRYSYVKWLAIFVGESTTDG